MTIFAEEKCGYPQKSFVDYGYREKGKIKIMMHKIYVSTCSAFIKTLFLQKTYFEKSFSEKSYFP